MSHSIGAARDPSVTVRRRHLPALRAGMKVNSQICPAQRSRLPQSNKVANRCFIWSAI